MMKEKITLLFVLLLVSKVNVQAQGIVPKSSIQINVGLPVNLANESFKGIMQGLINVSASYQRTFENAFSIGIGGNLTYFTLNEFKVNEPMKGGLLMPSGFLKVGHEKFHSKVFGTDAGIRLGYTFNRFNSDSIQSRFGAPQYQESFFAEPYVGVMFYMDENTSIRFGVSYILQDFGFEPSNLALSSNSGFDPANFGRRTQYLTFGFGYTHYFKQKK